MAIQTKTIEQGSLTRDIKYTEMVFGVSELRQYVVTEAPMLRGRRWRHQFNEKVLPAIEGLMRAQDLEFDNTEDLANLMPLVTGLLSDIIDDVVELVITYSSELEGDREWIEENASEGQLIGAFFDILQLALPLAEVGSWFGNLSGPKVTTTS